MRQNHTENFVNEDNIYITSQLLSLNSTDNESESTEVELGTSEVLLPVNEDDNLSKSFLDDNDVGDIIESDDNTVESNNKEQFTEYSFDSLSKNSYVDVEPDSEHNIDKSMEDNKNNEQTAQPETKENGLDKNEIQEEVISRKKRLTRKESFPILEKNTAVLQTSTPITACYNFKKSCSKILKFPLNAEDCGTPNNTKLKKLEIPFRAIKRTMKINDAIATVQVEAAVLTTYAVELFIDHFVYLCYQNAKRKKRNTIRYEDIGEVRAMNDRLEFLDLMFP